MCLKKEVCKVKMNNQTQYIAGDVKRLKKGDNASIKSVLQAFPKIGEKEAALTNLAYANAPTLLEGARLTWERSSAGRQFTTRIRLNSDKQSYFIWLQPLASFSPFFSSAAPGWPDSVNCQLFEIAFGPLIDMLAGKIGMPLRVTEVDEVTTSQPDFYLDGSEGKYIHFTYRAHSKAIDSYGLLDISNVTQLYFSGEVKSTPAQLNKLSAQWRMSLGKTSLSTEELSALEVGDVILPERGIHPANLAIYLIAHNHKCVGVASSHDEKLVITDIDLGKMMENVETKKQTIETTPVADSDMPQQGGAILDNLDIELTFEVGKVNVALSELTSLAVGSVLSLGCNPAQQPVTIRCNDSVLGRAELVLVGDELGVRIVSWSKNA